MAAAAWRPIAIAGRPICAMLLSSHVAAPGLVFSTGASLPAMFRGGAFIGEHGSWNRTEHNRHRVVFARFAGGRPVGRR